jgi:thioredoxin-dependent peroxiredoxin
MRSARTVWTASAAVVLALGIFASRAASGAAKAPAVGTTAPDFTLDSQEGKPVSLREFRGKWVVLYFYPKDFTKGCTIEAREFQNAAPKFAAQNAVILGVSVQSASSHKDFCAKEGLGFKLLSDEKHEVSSAYGSVMNFGVAKFSSRHTFLIGPDGVIVKEFLDVKPGKHSDEVLAALTEAQKNPAKP